MKNAFIRSKRNASVLTDDQQTSPREYAGDKVELAADDLAHDTANVAVSGTKTAVRQGRGLFQGQRERRAAEKHRGNTVPTKRVPTPKPSQGAIPTHESPLPPHALRESVSGRQGASLRKPLKKERPQRRPVSPARPSGRMSRPVRRGPRAIRFKAGKAVKIDADMKTGRNMARIAARAARTTAAWTGNAMAKAAAAGTRAAAAALQGLVSALAAGGWAAMAAVLVVSMAGLLLASGFGIFFSGTQGGETLSAVMGELQGEYEEEMALIQAQVAHDAAEREGAYAPWWEVLAVYAVRIATDPDGPQEVATMDKGKKERLRTVFREMNRLSYRTEHRTDPQGGLGGGKAMTLTVLVIMVTPKTAEEMAEDYRFSPAQREQLSALLDRENDALWEGLGV